MLRRLLSPAQCDERVAQAAVRRQVVRLHPHGCAIPGKRFLDAPEVNEDALAVSAIDEVGPANHFFGSPHTLERYESAFYTPLLSDWQNFENWRDAGSLDATQRANRIWKKLLEDYEEPPLDPAIADELEAFVARRIEEGGAPPL